MTFVLTIFLENKREGLQILNLPQKSVFFFLLNPLPFVKRLLFSEKWSRGLLENVLYLRMLRTIRPTFVPNFDSLPFSLLPSYHE